MNNETKNCPFCGEEIKATAIKCKHCGEFLNNNRSKNDNSEKINNKNNNSENHGCADKIKNILCVIVVILIIAYFLPELDEEPTCDGNTVKDVVINTFKENNPYYLRHQDSVTDVILEYPAATAYDESLNKYTCKGTVVVKTSQSANDYRCNITYTAQKVKEGIYVESSACAYKYFTSY